MNINLREEETNEYITLFHDYLEEIQNLNKKVTDVLNEVMIQSKYDKLQKTISSIIDAYTDVIVNGVEKTFTNWEESEASLRALLRMYQAGDAADAVCAQVEQTIKDLTASILRIEKMDAVITDRPVVSEEGLDRLEGVCKSARTDMQDMKSKCMSHLQLKEDENDIYGTLSPLVEEISIEMEAFFEASLNSFKQLHEFVKDKEVELYDSWGVNDISDIQQEVGETFCATDYKTGNNGDSKESVNEWECPMWEEFQRRTADFEKKCEQDQTISHDEKENIKRYYKNWLYLKLETNLKIPIEQCKRVNNNIEKNIDNNTNDIQKIMDLCMWYIEEDEVKKQEDVVIKSKKEKEAEEKFQKELPRECKFRKKLVEEYGSKVVPWPGIMENWLSVKTRESERGFFNIFSEINYEEIKKNYYREEKLKKACTDRNLLISKLSSSKSKIERKNIESQIGDLQVILDEADIDMQAERYELKQVYEANIVDLVEEVRDKITDDTTAIKYVWDIYDELKPGIVSEYLLREIIDIIPVLSICTNEEKDKYCEQIICEMKSYCGIKMDNAKNLDYNYRKKIKERKDRGHPNAQKLFNKFSDEIIIFNDEEIGTSKFSAKKEEFGIHFNPIKEENTKKAGDTFFHEVGHYIDFILKRPSCKKDFREAFKKDREIFIRQYNQSWTKNERVRFNDDLKYSYDMRNISDLIKGWNIILESDNSQFYNIQKYGDGDSNPLFNKGGLLNVIGCEKTGFLSKSEAEEQKKEYASVRKIGEKYYKRLLGSYGHDGYDTIPATDIYYDFYMTVNSGFNPWGKERYRYQPEKEAFAEMFEADMGGSNECREFFEKYFPNTWTEYQRIRDNNCE